MLRFDYANTPAFLDHSGNGQPGSGVRHVAHWKVIQNARMVFGSLLIVAAASALTQTASAQCGPTGFTSTVSLRTARAVQQRAALLPNGKVLIVGGASTYCPTPTTADCAKNKTAELYDPTTGQFADVNLTHSVTATSLTVLSNGKVLIAGGYDVYSGVMTRTASLYDPATGTVTDTNSLNQARGFHTATLLGNGQVLIAGGQTVPNSGTGTASSELYDPASGTFTAIANLTSPRLSHTSTQLSDGRVLIVSGHTSELYDPSSRTFIAGPQTTYQRYHHTATRLTDGLVLLAGGDLDPAVAYGTTEAELYNPSTNTFTKLDANGAAGAMVRIRHGHSATLLPNGTVLIAGGHDGSYSVDTAYWRYSNTTEIFDPVTRRFTLGPNLVYQHSGHTATLLNDGRILIAGGGGVVSGSYYNLHPKVEVSGSTYCTGASYLGCYTDDANRAMPMRLMTNGATVESCVSAAAARGFPYAALEWYGACLAGYTPAYSTTNESECNTPCTANRAEMCGGAWRSSMYRTNVTLPQPAASAYQGCYTDDSARALDARLIASGATVESCVAAAKARGFRYAGLQWRGECYAGNSLGYAQADPGACNTACSANSSQTCGGAWANSVYATGITPTPVQNPASLYLGCYADDANHALDALLFASGATIESCIAAAKAMGYDYAGLQWYGACSAGNLLAYSRTAESECNTPCDANPTQTCGGEWRNSMYRTR